MWKEHDIILRGDDSFVIIKDGYPYHVPNEGEWVEEWAEINAYALDNPERISEELPGPAPTLEEIRAAKLAEIIAGANTASAAIKARYSQPEIDSWQQQETEAMALLADPEAAAPLVRKLAANVKTDALEFAQRIVNNAQAAATATEAIILQQQAMENTVNLAQNTEEIMAVAVAYNLG